MDKEGLAAELSVKLSGVQYHQHREERRGEGRGFVLMYLTERGGRAFPGEIGQAMGVTTPRVAVILRELEQEGMITRTVVEDDRRKVCVALTEQGRERVRRKRQRMERFLRKWLDRLSEEDAAALPRIFEALEAVRNEDRSRRSREEWDGVREGRDAEP